MKYADEKFNLRLLFIYVLKKSLYLLIGAGIGAVLFGGVYFLAHNVFAPAPKYTATGKLYLEYTDAVKLDNVYINSFTWDDISRTDDVYNRFLEYMWPPNQDFIPPREETEAKMNTTLLTDVRVLTITGTDDSPEMAIRIADAYMNAITDFALATNDIVEVKVLTPVTEAKTPVEFNRLARTTLLGVVAGVVITFFIICFAFAADTSYYIPETFEERYKIPVLATFVGNEISEWEKSAMKLKLDKVKGPSGVITIADAVVGNANEKVAEVCTALLGEESVAKVYSPGEIPDSADELAKAETVILLVEASAHNSGVTERTLEFLKFVEVDVKGVILYNADRFIYNAYIWPGTVKKKICKRKEQ